MPRRKSLSEQDPLVIDNALAALDAEELRQFVRDVLASLDEKDHARAVQALIDCATQNASGWAPAVPSDRIVSEIVAFAEAAARIGHANPSQVDAYLQLGSNAFLAKDYKTSARILQTLLVPILECEIDLGQHEMIDEVLGIDPTDCAGQHVIATYMTTALEDRANAVRDAIEKMGGIGHFWEPIREFERVAVEPLPDLCDFLPRWRSLIEESIRLKGESSWYIDEHKWLREVVKLMEGADGLAEIARSSRRGDDLQAWCRALVEASDWKVALAAYKEAAEIVEGRTHWCGEFLDGAVLAAQQLGRRDVPAHLERAWRAAPCLSRLRRWLGYSGSRAVVKRRATAALAACPKKLHRQRAFLQVVLGTLEPAAKLLASAPGLGWSDSEHPGHLLFSLFCTFLSDEDLSLAMDTGPLSNHIIEINEHGLPCTDPDEPRLVTATIEDILATARITGAANDTERAAVLASMRRAAKKRIAGVTKNQRHRYYGHAASLAAACVAIDPTPDSRAWMATIRSEYRRYPALQRELKRHDSGA